jgi:hypothetical protein
MRQEATLRTGIAAPGRPVSLAWRTLADNVERSQ